MWKLVQQCLGKLSALKAAAEDVLDVDEETHAEMPPGQLAVHLALNNEAAKVWLRSWIG